MNCPIDGAVLDMSERQGVEIDYCPTCRGVWLDRGELDKLIERSETWSPQSAAPVQPFRQERSYDRDDDRSSRPYKKKKSFLSEMFDD